MNIRQVKIFDIPFVSESRETILKLMYDRIKNQEKTYVVTANAEIAMYGKENKNYFDLLRKATYIVPDGIGIVKGAKILKQDIPERVPGIELMTDLLSMANENNQSVYFYGAKKEVIEFMVKNLLIDYPNLNIVGYCDGYNNDEDDSVTNEVIRLNPDYVFVAKGCPLQDEWINQVMAKVDKGLFMGVGGSFDVLGGFEKRAPEIYQKLNLEWLYRIAGNPKRWKRSLALPKFVVEVIKEKYKG